MAGQVVGLDEWSRWARCMVRGWWVCGEGIWVATRPSPDWRLGAPAVWCQENHGISCREEVSVAGVANFDTFPDIAPVVAEGAVKSCLIRGKRKGPG